MGYKPKMKEASPQLKLDFFICKQIAVGQLQISCFVYLIPDKFLNSFFLVWPKHTFSFENELFHYENTTPIALPSAGGTSPVKREDEGETASPAREHWKQECSSCHGQMHLHDLRPQFSCDKH